jgi:hypothetical protein
MTLGRSGVFETDVSDKLECRSIDSSRVQDMGCAVQGEAHDQSTVFCMYSATSVY